MPDKSIWSRHHELVLRVHGKIEREELPELLEAANTYARAHHDRYHATKEYQRQGVLGASRRKKGGIQVGGDGGR